MPKSKTEINPVSIERVKQVINESGMTQKDFAKKVLFYEQQTLSKIVNGKAPLTRESAARIAAYFEDINDAWLLGESDIRSKDDYSFYNGLFDESAKDFAAFEELLDRLSYPDEIYENAFKLYLHSMGLSTKCVPVGEPSKKPPYLTPCHTGVADEDENILAVLTPQEIYEIAREIADFAEFKIKKLIEGSKADG
mgnify:FL=1